MSPRIVITVAAVYVFPRGLFRSGMLFRVTPPPSPRAGRIRMPASVYGFRLEKRSGPARLSEGKLC